MAPRPHPKRAPDAPEQVDGAWVPFALVLRRGLRGLAGALAILILSALTVLDAMEAHVQKHAVALFVVIACFVAHRMYRHFRAPKPSFVRELELGVFVTLLAFFGVLRADRSLDGDAYPILFVCVAVVSAFARPAVAVFVLGYVMALEVTVRIVGFAEPSLLPALGHLAFLMVFTGLNAAVLRTEVARLRNRFDTQIEDEKARLRDDARSFRLLAAPTKNQDPRPDEDDRLARSGVEEIHQSVLFALRLVRESLDLDTAMLLWQNDAGTHLRISELVTDSSEIVEGPFALGDGVFGAAISAQKPLCLSNLRSSTHLPYYAGPCPVGSLCVLPVFEHGKVRGVFVADRTRPDAFQPREVAMLEEAARYAVRTIHNERVFLQLERAKAEQGKLYRAAEALSSSKTEADVISAGIHSAREITSVDFAAVTLFDEAHKTHEICAVSGDFEGVESAIAHKRFRHNSGLVSMALENRHPLPYRGVYDERKQVVFTRHLLPPSVPSILVLPLVAHERPLGTLVLGSRRRGAFSDAVRSTLEVLASHLAVSLEGARMVRRLEELATTDGMTGLLNKRALLDVAAQKLAAAKRFNRQLAVIVTDIDHFKKVNDTHGHDVGDVIIKGLGQILRHARRSTDVVARFGGEEFVVICEETDERGALQLAERVREELERTAFVVGENGTTLQVTCSLGVAVYPAGGATWDQLFRAADTALYASKQRGRNQTTLHGTAGPASIAGDGTVKAVGPGSRSSAA